MLRSLAVLQCSPYHLLREFKSDLMALLIDVLPFVTARKGIAGRAKVAQAFEHYFRIDGHKEASILMRNRYESSFRNGVPVADIARFEVGGAVAILVNTAPAAFWMLFLIFSHPQLLTDIRKEVDSIVNTTGEDGDTFARSLDITSLKEKCPLFTSTFQEVLRFRAMGTSVRQVMADTVLKDQYFLKKDSMIQMPSQAIHKDPSIWGSDVDDFNPRRFMKATVPKTENGKRPVGVAF